MSKFGEFLKKMFTQNIVLKLIAIAVSFITVILINAL